MPKPTEDQRQALRREGMLLAAAGDSKGYTVWLESEVLASRARVAALEAGIDDMVAGHDEDADERTTP